jgi:hypothetical protein
MSCERRRYVRRPGHIVAAVQLAIDTDGITYRKWGGEQHAKAGDWIVDNEGDIYTVDADVFARTYRRVGPGTYEKVTAIWAARAQHAGSVRTREGGTHYCAGDYLVASSHDGVVEYAIAEAAFEALYVPGDES